MARILFLLFIAFLVYLVVRQLMRAQAKKPPENAAAPSGEDMVACARCGVNVPRSETREVDGRLICASNPNCK